MTLIIFSVFYLLVDVVFGNFPFIARDALYYMYRTFSVGTLTFLGTHDFRMTKNCGAGFLSSILVLLLGSLCRSSLLRHTQLSLLLCVLVPLRKCLGKTFIEG